MTTEAARSYTKLAMGIFAAALILGSVAYLTIPPTVKVTTITSVSTVTSTFVVNSTSTVGFTTTTIITQTVRATTGSDSCQDMGVSAGAQIVSTDSTGGNSTLNWHSSSSTYFAYLQKIFISGTLAFSVSNAAAYPGIGITGTGPIPNSISISKGQTYDVTFFFYVEEHGCIVNQYIPAD